MRVALLHFTFAEYTISLANALAETAQVTLFHPENLAKVCEGMLHPSIKTRVFSKPHLRSLRNIGAMQRLISLIRAEQPDVLHFQANGELWFELALLTSSLPPLVTTVHDIFPHPGDRMSFRLPFSRYTARIPYYRSKQLIVHTGEQMADLTGKLGVPCEQINIVMHGELGSVYRRWAGDAAAVPQREPHTLLFFGRIWPYKGLRFLVDAMSQVAESIPDVKLIIAGRGEDLEAYFPAGIDPARFKIINQFIPHGRVAGLFQRSAIAVLPYIEASQSGVASIAYGFGVPVIASRVGGLREMVRDGEDGLLVPPRDSRILAEAIIRLLNDPDLQRRMGAAAAERCKVDLDWSKIAAETVQAYDKALQKS